MSADEVIGNDGGAVTGVFGILLVRGGSIISFFNANVGVSTNEFFLKFRFGGPFVGVLVTTGLDIREVSSDFDSTRVDVTVSTVAVSCTVLRLLFDVGLKPEFIKLPLLLLLCCIITSTSLGIGGSSNRKLLMFRFGAGLYKYKWDPFNSARYNLRLFSVTSPPLIIPFNQLCLMSEESCSGLINELNLTPRVDDVEPGSTDIDDVDDCCC